MLSTFRCSAASAAWDERVPPLDMTRSVMANLFVKEDTFGESTRAYRGFATVSAGFGGICADGTLQRKNALAGLRVGYTRYPQ